MKRRLRFQTMSCGVAVAFLTTLLFPNVSPAREDVPDFHGLWITDGSARGATHIVDGRMPDGTPATPVAGSPSALTEEGRIRYERNKAGIAASDPDIDQSLLCIPSGFPRIALNDQPVLIMQEDEIIIWTSESSQGIPRKIWIGGEHANPWPSRMGDSVGRWDADTLVIDTVNVAPETFINSRGLPHSAEFRTTERWRLIEGGAKLENQFTFVDPVIFTEPWEATVVYDRSTFRPLDDICTDPVRSP